MRIQHQIGIVLDGKLITKKYSLILLGH